jgi:hypothetical protein
MIERTSRQLFQEFPFRDRKDNLRSQSFQLKEAPLHFR